MPRDDVVEVGRDALGPPDLDHEPAHGVGVALEGRGHARVRLPGLGVDDVEHEDELLEEEFDLRESRVVRKKLLRDTLEQRHLDRRRAVADVHDARRLAAGAVGVLDGDNLVI